VYPSRNLSKIVIVALALVAVLASTTLLVVPVKAQQNQGSIPLSPSQVPATALRVKTRAFLSFRPNPVGLNQIFLVNMWLNPPTHKSRYLTNYTVTIQKPNGDTEVIKMKSYPADTTAWFEYIADQEGTWKLKFDFPGGYFNTSQVPGGFMEPSVVTIGECYYEPSSTGWQELVVQKDIVASWPPSPLPTDYWTRPVSPENREWWWIAGHYPWRGPGIGDPNWPANTNHYWDSHYSFTPWVQAPNSAHIVWKRQASFGGLIGPIEGSQKVEAYSPGLGGGNAPSVIYEGRCYQVVTKPGGKDVWQCYDLRTGEVYWEVSPPPIPTTAGLFGMGKAYAELTLEYSEGVPEVAGAAPQFGKTIYFVATGGGRLIKIDPWTATVVLNASIAPLDSGTYYRNGYVLSVQNTNPYWPFIGPPPKYFLINWTTLGVTTWMGATVYNFTASIRGNVSWPLGGMWAVAYDFESGMAAGVNVLSNPNTGAWLGTEIKAARLRDGKSLWNKTLPADRNYTNYSPMCVVADHGKIAFLTMGGNWLAYNLADGSLAWQSETMDYPWDACGFGAYATASAYGLFYRFAYSGVYAFNWTNGKIVWKFEAPANPYETPYIDSEGHTVYSFNGGGWIADGKLFTYNTEHTPTQPLTRGWRLFCLNATTGKNIWNITGSMAVGAMFGMVSGSMADGYLVTFNSYDGYTYCFGKGKSQTTVTAPDVVVPKGTGVVIKGSVLDMSPAQPGTPCVAKESMTVWMEYLHMQKSYPSDVKGVPVTLTAIKSDGKVIDLGTVTTNGYYGTFSYAWTPPDEGTYTIIACFMGDDSYGSSAAATAITVGPAPAEIEIPEYPTPTDYMPMLTALAIAVIIAIIIGIINLYALFKRK